MYEKHILNFVYSYFILKTLANLIVMPSLGSKKDADNLQTTHAKDHYDEVKHNRRIKGMISIFLGIVLGIFIFIKGSSILFSLFTGFFSMNILYEAMWQNRFIFEEKIISTMDSENNIDQDESRDLQIYTQIYQKHRFAGNVIEVSSITLSLIFSILYTN